ncbi:MULTISPECIES: hypothetical protein [unclassified Microcoleus]|uniref:hypothetical protein n=1 Tax=unclassified Microcoleus TaxID=2642155 RepID=UPI0025CD9953|nr:MULTISPECIES: hypothetical protein [unclassified Microcoleus]
MYSSEFYSPGIEVRSQNLELILVNLPGIYSVRGGGLCLYSREFYSPGIAGIERVKAGLEIKNP